jgi:hypothetical protein
MDGADNVDGRIDQGTEEIPATLFVLGRDGGWRNSSLDIAHAKAKGLARRLLPIRYCAQGKQQK